MEIKITSTSVIITKDPGKDDVVNMWTRDALENLSLRDLFDDGKPMWLSDNDDDVMGELPVCMFGPDMLNGWDGSPREVKLLIAPVV